MKQTIHIDIMNDEGENECWERRGGLFITMMALLLVWRYQGGRITIGEEDEHSA